MASTVSSTTMQLPGCYTNSRCYEENGGSSHYYARRHTVEPSGKIWLKCHIMVFTKKHHSKLPHGHIWSSNRCWWPNQITAEQCFLPSQFGKTENDEKYELLSLFLRAFPFRDFYYANVNLLKLSVMTMQEMIHTSCNADEVIQRHLLDGVVMAFDRNI